MNYKSIILWGLFGAILLSGILYTAHIMPGNTYTPLLDFKDINAGKILILTTATLLLILHAVWNIGVPDGLVLIAFSFLLSLIFEIAGVQYGIVFGGRYIYSENIQPSFMGVPWLIPLIWAGFIYCGYTIVASFSIWISNGKQSHNQRKFFRNVIFAAASAITVLAIDVMMEPLQVNAGNWRWLDEGYYYDIPSGNFLGWFLVAFVSVLIFKIIQNYMPRKTEKISAHVLLIPVIGYGLLYGVFAFWAFRLGFFSLIFVGLVTMFPITLLNLFTYIQWKFRISKDKSISVQPDNMI